MTAFARTLLGKSSSAADIRVALSSIGTGITIPNTDYDDATDSGVYNNGGSGAGHIPPGGNSPSGPLIVAKSFASILQLAGYGDGANPAELYLGGAATLAAAFPIGCARKQSISAHGLQPSRRSAALRQR